MSPKDIYQLYIEKMKAFIITQLIPWRFFQDIFNGHKIHPIYNDWSNIIVANRKDCYIDFLMLSRELNDCYQEFKS